MESKIDLDAIINKIMAENMDVDLWMNDKEYNVLRSLMKESAHQALVLASEMANIVYKFGEFNTGKFIVIVDKQSILDVEKLIS